MTCEKNKKRKEIIGQETRAETWGSHRKRESEELPTVGSLDKELLIERFQNISSVT